MKAYCIIHHYGYSYNYESGFSNERDLVAVTLDKKLAKNFLVTHGLDVVGYCGQRPDWLNKEHTRFGYSVNVGPDEDEWDYYAIQEQELLTELES